ncbi:MAG TPA: class II glutamine amidotransferase [Solirubrobacteraceae bacterium]|jgi:glutamine amidotransferase|nr:class II glutamine amidotransferase [Solirubrobacteraceae bacterium]
MCRVLGYLGEPVSLESILYDTDSALVRQSYSPRMMDAFLNLAGFGMAAWDDRSVREEEPFTYRVSTLPTYDANLRSMCRKLAPTCLLAHVRGVTWSSGDVISEQNLHPFRFPGAGLVMAHNGHLRSFGAMRYDLLDHLPSGLSRHIAGTTDSEWIYALLLAQLGDRAADPDAADLVEATRAVLQILRDARARHGIDTSSPINLFMATRQCLVATRFVMDYGWYPDDDPLLEVDLPYVSLWYTAGRSYVDDGDGWQMVSSDGRPQSLLIASEPLTADTSTWLEVPEYSLLSVVQEADGLSLETVELDV